MRCCRSRTRAPRADEYFADGIADEVRGKLSRVSGLEVIASSSASQYKGTTKTPQEIASELGADYLLVGTVRWAGAEGGKRRVQVVPELIDARTGDVKWQQSFDTDITDVFEVQSQIATRVAGALGVALGGSEQQQLAQPSHRNVEAYQLYLKATRGPGRRSGQPAGGQRGTWSRRWRWIRRSPTPGPPVHRARADSTRTAFGSPEIGRAGEGSAGPNGGTRPECARRPTSRRRDTIAHRRRIWTLRGPRWTWRCGRRRPTPRCCRPPALADMGDGDLGSALAKLERAREIDPRSYITLYSLSRSTTISVAAADAEATRRPHCWSGPAT